MKDASRAGPWDVWRAGSLAASSGAEMAAPKAASTVLLWVDLLVDALVVMRVAYLGIRMVDRSVVMTGELV